jgi:hypothetical protein
MSRETENRNERHPPGEEYVSYGLDAVSLGAISYMRRLKQISPSSRRLWRRSVVVRLTRLVSVV